MTIALLVVVLLIQAVPQVPARDARPAPATGTASIAGRVVDAETGEPVRDAIVQLGSIRMSGPPTPLEVDERGVFTATGLPAGDYILIVSPPELHATYVLQFVNNDMNAMMAGSVKPSVQLKDGETREIVVRLERALAIDGRVVDEFGEPMGEIQVSAEGVGMLPFGGGLGQTTDDRGAFRLHSLGAGTYRVCATPSGADWRMGPQPAGGDLVQQRYVKTCYPSSPEGGGEQVMLRPSGAPMLTIVMQRVRGYTIAGRAASETGAKNLSVSVNRIGPIGESTSIRVEMQDGRFTARGVPPGEYSIVASSGGDQRGSLGQMLWDERARLTVKVEHADVTGLELVTSKGATLAGRIVPESPLPAGTALRVAASGEMSLFSFMDDQRTATVREDMTFELSGIHDPAMFDVAGLPSGWVVASIRYRGADVTDTRTRVATTADPKEFEIVVSPRSAQVVTRAVDDKGAQAVAAFVLVMPAKGDRLFVPEQIMRADPQVNADGSVAQAPVRPGDYVLVALPVVDLMQVMRDPARLGAVRQLGQTITLAAGDRKTVDVVMRRIPEGR